MPVPSTRCIVCLTACHRIAALVPRWFPPDAGPPAQAASSNSGARQNSDFSVTWSGISSVTDGDSQRARPCYPRGGGDESGGERGRGLSKASETRDGWRIIIWISGSANSNNRQGGGSLPRFSSQMGRITTRTPAPRRRSAMETASAGYSGRLRHALRPRGMYLFH